MTAGRDDQGPAAFEGAAASVAGAEDVGGPALGAVVASAWRVARQGRGLARAGAGLAAEAARVALGRSRVQAARGDWRFADPTWEEHPGYRRLKQLYLAFAQTLDQVVAEANVDWRTRERARFATTVIGSALAPTNTLAGNPAAIKRAIETGGGSLVRGLRHFVSDARHNGGMPAQVDTSGFRVGENLAVTSGAVIHRDEVLEVLQYGASTPSVTGRPVVLVPPPINKYYFLDLAPGRSFVEYAVSRGIPFFAISWRNPQPEHGHWGLDTYAEAVLEAIDAACDVSGSDDVHLLGMCAGGIITATVLAHLAATADARVRSATLGVTLLDFDVPAMVGLFRSRPLLAAARGRSSRAGVLPGSSMASVFTWMRPNELVWNYWVNNYLMGERPPAFDILAWNADRTNLPATLHGQFLDIFEGNLLVAPGALTVLGSPVDLTRVKCDTYVTGGLTDHITPWQGCYRATQLMAGPSTFMLSPVGHIQTQVSPPGNPKAYYLTGPEPGPDPQAWKAAAERREGSWWEHWAEWILARSGDERPAPTELGNHRHKVLDPAPGRYVHG